MAWQNAPVLNKLTASQQGGKRGAQLWGVDHKGKLYTIYQKTPGGAWSDWMGTGWSEKNSPQQVYELAASQQHEGGVQLWVLDMKRQLWTIEQGTPGGDWLAWKGPGWNSMPKGLEFKKIAATRLAGGRGAQFWGISDKGMLISCDQVEPAGNWTPLKDWPVTPEKSQWIEVTACQQGDGKGAVWALDTKMQLWGMGQESKGGKWGAWSGPNWLDAPKLRNIAAVEVTVVRDRETYHGACIWGITDDYKIVYNQQSRPGMNWFGWSAGSYKDELRGYEITAARQNNQSARVWVISNNQVLVSQQVDINSSPPGWEGYWTPEA
jgi:hypothetical protein